MNPKIWSSIEFNEEEVESIFTKMEFTQIRQVCNEIDDKDTGQRIKKRNVYVRWLLESQKNAWLFDKLWNLVQLSNKEMFNLDLAGPPKEIQLGHYIKDHFHDWHTDAGDYQFKKRSLNVVVQLSDPKDYSGGGLEFRQNNIVYPAPKTKGTVVIFPAILEHQVQIIEEGNRFSLVACIDGVK